MIVDVLPLVLVLQNNKRRVSISIAGVDEMPVDPVQLDLQVQDMGSTVKYSDSYTAPPPAGTRIVREDVGKYYLVWGDPLAPANVPTQTETHCRGQTLFVWSVVGATGTEEVQRVQTVEMVTARTMNRIRAFQLQIDKARMPISVDPTDFCPLGYTEGWLLEYLRGGMTLINAYQPYPTWCAVDDFPECFVQTLYDAALVVGVNAQTLYAIASDIDQFSDQGNAFIINHHPKLAAFSAAMSQRLDKAIPQLKLHFVRSGSVKIEAGPSFRLNVLATMAPSGALFRNTILAQ